MALSRDDILKVEDLPIKEIDIPEWGGSVFVKALSGKDRDAFEASMVEMRGFDALPSTANRRAKLVGRAVVDEDGNRLFTEADINALGGKSAAVLDRLYDIAAEMSGLSDEDVEKLAGNSEAVPSDGSISDSPETSSTAP